MRDWTTAKIEPVPTMKFVVLLALVCATSIVAADVFTSQDAARVKGVLKAAQGSNGLFGELDDTFAAVSALKRLGESVPNKDRACDALKTKLSKARSTDVQSLAYILQSLEALGCGDKVSDDVKQGLQFNLNSDKLENIYAAATTVFALAANKHASASDYDFSKAATTVGDLQQDDGSFSSTVDGDEVSGANTGLALQTLAGIQKNAGRSEDVTTALTAAADKLEQLMTLGNVAESVDFAAGSKLSGLAAAAAVLQGLDGLSNSQSAALDVTDAQMRKMCAFVVDNKYTRDVSDLFALLEALHVCANNKVHVPTVIQLVDARPASLKVRVTNVLDKPQAGSVSLASATSEDNKVIVKDAAFSASGDEFTLANDKLAAAAPGFYSLKITATPSGGKASSLVRKVKVATDVKPASISVWVSESAKSDGDGSAVKAKFPEKLGSKVAAASTQYLYADVTLSGGDGKFQPSQVFIQLTKAGTDKSAVFPAVPKKDAKGHFLAKTNLGTTEFLESLFGAGEYDISVIVGDALLVKPAKWTAGTIVLSLPKDKEADPHTDLFAAKPDIKHAFRAAETRPSALMATLFTGLAAAPFVVLLLSLMASGLSVQFPADAQEFLANVLFQGSIGAILLLYIAYWLFLNIFQALGMLAILSVVAVATGNRALKRRNQRNAAAAAARAEAGATAAASGAGAAGSHSHSD